MKEIFMAATIELIQMERIVDLVNKINNSNPELKETKDGIKYFLIKT